MYLITYVHIIHMFIYVYIYFCKMNGSNYATGKKEKLGLFCGTHTTLEAVNGIVLLGSEFELFINVYCKL